MRMSEADSRKSYIESVRRSFDEPERDYEWEKEEDVGGDAGGSSFFKVRLLVALFLLAAYILCDQADAVFYNYSAGDVAKIVQEGWDFSDVEDYAAALGASGE